MPGNKSVMYMLAWLACLITAQVSWQADALATVNVQAGSGLDDATCLGCHHGKSSLMVVDADGEERTLLGIGQKRYLKGVHGDMACVDCHVDIVDSKVPHEKSDLPKPDCASCHETLWEITKRQDLTVEKARLGVVVENIEAYRDSLHANASRSSRSGVKAHCDDCHDTHFFDVPPRGTSKRTEWHLNSPTVCSKCHEDSLEEYLVSVHGVEATEKGNLKAAVCVDCHTTHEISRTRRDPFKLQVTMQCGNCHEDEFETYRDTYHGQINTLGYAYTAKCYDCHDSHEILAVDDPDSTVHPDNRLETCQE
ncbi:MAG: NapC/NirT family cytochrome c, partial [Gammaproteobacteria bacterium]|nr:NapC/NirT family cytochrome c [Gammaproteobacteria bacterium]